MAIKTTNEIVCDNCGVSGLAPLEDQFPSTLNPPKKNPLTDDLSKSQVRRISRQLGWKVGHKCYCPKCLVNIFDVL